MPISRRAILFGGGVATAAAAIPVGSHLVWQSKEFQRPDFNPDLPMAPAGRRSWMNWSGIERATPKQIAAPTSVDEIVETLKSSPAPIRAVGSGHSFSPLVPSEGTILDIGAIAGLQKYDTVAQTASFGAGTRLQNAARALGEHGLGFKNMPDIDIPTFAGACSTGTHGTGYNMTAIHDYVEGFQLVTASGDIKEVSRGSDPDLFAAGKVSLGALGIITRYDLKVSKEVNLRRTVTVLPIGELLEQFENNFKNHRNFEFYYLPNTGMAAAIVLDLHEGEITGRAPTQDDDTLEQLQSLRDNFGWAPWLRSKIAQTALKPGVFEDESDKSWKLLSTARPTKFNEMEYHVPLNEGLKTVQKIIEMADSRNFFFFPIEVRVTAPDDAWLSPFNDGRRVSISIHAARNEKYDYFFSEFEPVFLKMGGRPHWGKLHSLGAKQLANIYPKFEQFAELRRGLDPGGKFASPYMKKIWGIA